MTELQIPLKLERARKPVFAGFWLRLGASLIDSLCLGALGAVLLYLNGRDMEYIYYTTFINLVFVVGYHIYLPKRYGGTPGKLLVGTTIIRTDGEAIGWREAFLRHMVNLILFICSAGITISCVLAADETVYMELGWMKRNEYLMSLSTLFTPYMWISNIWIWSEFIVLLTNKERRAIHDFIAGTVVVRTMYIPRLREEMEPVEDHK
jgi:uncharacterized RDD family membrane protein YckC